MKSNWFTNFDFNAFSSLFDVDELENLYNKVMEKLTKEEEKVKDDDVETYKYYDKKLYNGDTLVDHVEKEYKNGECVKDVHEPCFGISCASSVVNKGCCSKSGVEHKCEKECKKECEHKCEGKCEDVKSYKEEIEFLKKVNNDYKEQYVKLLDEHEELASTLDAIRDTAKELLSTLKTYEKENTELKEKLNNIKKMF